MFSLESIKENFDEKYENIKDDIENWDWDKKKKEIKQYIYKHRFFIIIVPILILITVITFEINLKNKTKLKFKNIKQYGGDNGELSELQKVKSEVSNQNSSEKKDDSPDSNTKVKGEDKGEEKKGVRRRLGQTRRAVGLKTKGEREARQGELNSVDKKLLDKKKEKDDKKSEKKERKGTGFGKALKDGIGKGGSAIKTTVMKFFKYIFYFIAAGFLIFLPGIIYIIIVYLVIRKLVKNINIL